MDSISEASNKSRLKLLVIIAICSVVAVVAGGVAFAIHFNNAKINETDAQPKIEVITEATKTQASPQTIGDSARTSSPTQSVSEPAPVEARQPNSQPAYTTPEPATTRNSVPVEVATCNEVMKSSYTNLYNSLITAENTRWANEQDAIRADAQRRGLGFSGIVQAGIDAARPAHEAKLAAIETQYAQNLSSINCL